MNLWATTYNLGGGNSNMFYFYPYLGKIPILTNIFQMGWNHQLVITGVLAQLVSLLQVSFTTVSSRNSTGGHEGLYANSLSLAAAHAISTVHHRVSVSDFYVP